MNNDGDTRRRMSKSTLEMAAEQTVKALKMVQSSLFGGQINESNGETPLLRDKPSNLAKFVETMKVQDRALVNRQTKLVKIRDPCNGHTIAVIRDPKIDIQPYSSMNGVIDLQGHIENSQPPIFFPAVQPIKYSDDKISWETMLELIKKRKQQKQFWDFVESLRQVRITFNSILVNKYRSLPRALKKNLEV